MSKITVETILDEKIIGTEDGGRAKLFAAAPDDNENGVIFHFNSWDEDKKHEQFNEFVGKKVSIKIETID